MKSRSLHYLSKTFCTLFLLLVLDSYLCLPSYSQAVVGVFSNDRSQDNFFYLPPTLSIDEDQGKIYISNGDVVLVADTNTNTFIEKIDNASTNFMITDGKNPLNTTGILINDNKIYSLNTVTLNTIYVSNIENNSAKITSTIFLPAGFPLPATPIPFLSNGNNSLALNPNSNKLYFSNFFNDHVDVVDISKNEYLSRIPLGEYFSSEYGTNPIAVNKKTNKVYVADFFTDSLVVINGSTNEVIKVLKLGYSQCTGNTLIRGGCGLQGIAINEILNKVYLVYSNGPGIFIIDGNSDEKETFIKIEGEVEKLGSIAVNENTGFIYALGKDVYTNKLFVIDSNSNKVKKVIRVGLKPERLVVSSKKGKVFVVDNIFTPISVFVVDEQKNEQEQPFTKNLFIKLLDSFKQSVDDFASQANKLTVTRDLNAIGESILKVKSWFESGQSTCNNDLLMEGKTVNKRIESIRRTYRNKCNSGKRLNFCNNFTKHFSNINNYYNVIELVPSLHLCDSSY